MLYLKAYQVGFWVLVMLSAMLVQSRPLIIDRQSVGKVGLEGIHGWRKLSHSGGGGGGGGDLFWNAKRAVPTCPDPLHNRRPRWAEHEGEDSRWRNHCFEASGNTRQISRKPDTTRDV
ncbi:hypothetical protein QJS10_CPB17g01890 [Acorus calamus]|uniref:Uncharacterized protein n=1 Tax=Acorus calamus TaxID=4465 RepID=A0AAV9CTN5_ACOCL|nr:hypothetical protein QJS10_CPB17g01890 [Acorus calamus]